MSGESLEHYVQVIKSKPYTFKKHYLPHDVEVRELQTGNSRKQYLQSLGMTNIEVVPKLSIED
jgi:hypothetical protein